jgi:hypothetical protein
VLLETVESFLTAMTLKHALAWAGAKSFESFFATYIDRPDPESRPRPSDGQQRLGALLRQVDGEGVGVEGQHAEIPY